MKKLLLFLLISSLFFIDLQARNIDDMMDRNVNIPTQPQRVYATAPFGCFALYAIDPSLLIGWIFPLNKEQLPYLDKRMQTLPTIGRIFGAGRTANLEVLLSHRPDLILMWFKSDEFTAKEEDRLKLLNAPVVYAKEDSLFDYPKIFRFLGDVLKREERAEKLATYTEEVFQKVSLHVENTKDSKLPRVYYAEGLDGLLTECDNSVHAELLHIAGDVNIHRCKSTNPKGFEKISMETLIQYDPEVIIVQEKIFYDEIYNKPLWANINAVKNKRVHMIPRSPFNWFDRPPSFMRILGLQWTMSHIYPDTFNINIKQETKKFYKLFLGVDISDAQVDSILAGE